MPPPPGRGAFAHEFYSVFDREGLIIDVRGNDGGNIDSIIIEKLMRRAWAYWQSRHGEGIGVVPDIEVDMPPRASFDGADAQLDAGIAHLRKLTAEKPLREPRQPAFPKR